MSDIDKLIQQSHQQDQAIYEAIQRGNLAMPTKFTAEELLMYQDHLHYEHIKRWGDDYLWMSNQYSEWIQQIAEHLGMEGKFTQDFGIDTMLQYIDRKYTTRYISKEDLKDSFQEHSSE